MRCLFYVRLCMIGWRQYSAETSPLRRGSSLQDVEMAIPYVLHEQLRRKTLLIAYISPFEDQNEWEFRLIMFSFAPLLDCKFHYSLTLLSLPMYRNKLLSSVFPLIPRCNYVPIARRLIHAYLRLNNSCNKPCSRIGRK